MKYEALKGTKTAIHCSTPEEATQVAKIIGYDINFGEEYWGYYKKDYAIALNDEMYGRIGWFAKHEYTIISATEFIAANNPLPVKWYIVRNEENAEEINAFINEKSGGNAFLSSHAFVYCDRKYQNASLGQAALEGYTEITFDQFKQHVLKQEVMNKEVAYYEVIRAFPTPEKDWAVGEHVREIDSNSIWMKAPHFPEIFKPVYEEKFKVGDWVYFMGGGRSIKTLIWTVGTVGKIEGISPNNIVLAHGSNHPDGFRLATEKEIANTNLLTFPIGGYFAEKWSSGARFGCQKFTKEELLTYKRLFNKDLHAKLTIRDTEITERMIDTLLAKI